MVEMVELPYNYKFPVIVVIGHNGSLEMSLD